MKKYRKISAFIIALTLCISMAACGSTDSSDNTAVANTTTTTVSEEDSKVSETVTDKQEPDSDRPGEPPESMDEKPEG